MKVYIPVYRQVPTARVYYYSYNMGSAFWPSTAYSSNTYYTNQSYYRYGDDRKYQDNELGSFQGEVTYYGDDDWFEYKTSKKTWQVVLLHYDTIHPEEGDYVQVIGYVLDDVIYAEHVRILKSEYEYEYYDY